MVCRHFRTRLFCTLMAVFHCLNNNFKYCTFCSEKCTKKLLITKFAKINRILKEKGINGMQDLFH